MERERVKLVASLFTGNPALFAPAIARLEGRFGKIDYLSEPFDFKTTGYYEEEFGAGLERRMISFDELIETEGLAAIKLFTNGVEDEHLCEGRRTINIDPGYLALEKFVLASCKNFSHRICIGSNVYADLTLMYAGDGFLDLPWSYPDYRHERMKAVLMEIRKRYAFRIGKGLKSA